MRWRPQFSLRTMFVLVTLACLYFGLWEITKRSGVKDRSIALWQNSIFYTDTWQIIGPLMIKTKEDLYGGNTMMRERTCYKLWLFGPQFTIWESDEPIPIPPNMARRIKTHRKQ